jgi:hypothetical protein
LVGVWETKTATDKGGGRRRANIGDYTTGFAPGQI